MQMQGNMNVLFSLLSYIKDSLKYTFFYSLHFFNMKIHPGGVSMTVVYRNLLILSCRYIIFYWIDTS